MGFPQPPGIIVAPPKPPLVLHPDDVALWKIIERLAWAIADQEGLPLRVVEPKRRPLSDGAAGLCYLHERRIAIRVRCKERTEDGGAWGKHPEPWDDIVFTVAHELAHLRHPNHGSDFKRLEGYLHEQAKKWLKYQDYLMERGCRCRSI